MDLHLHATIKKLNPGEFPLTVVYKVNGQDHPVTPYPANSPSPDNDRTKWNWHDIDDSATSSGVTVNGTPVPLSTGEQPTKVDITLVGGRTVKASYRLSPTIPGHPGITAYWLVIDDM